MTQDTKAPERIWLCDEREIGGEVWPVFEEPSYMGRYIHEYVRADLLAAAEARADRAAQEAHALALREAADAIQSWWSPTMREAGEQAQIILDLMDTTHDKTDP